MEGPKGTRVGVDSENHHDDNVTIVPSEDASQKRKESEKSKESKPPSPKPYMPPFPFPKGLLRLRLIINLASFLMCLRSYM